MALKKYMKKFVSNRPELFVSLLMMFLLAGLATIFSPYFLGVNPNLSFSLPSLFVWLFAAASFLLGLKYGKGLFALKQLPIIILFILASVFFSVFYFVPIYISVIFCIVGYVVSYLLMNYNRNFLHLYALGALLLCVNMVFLGVPLLDIQMHVASSRESLGLLDFANPLFVAGFYFMLYSLVRMHGKVDKRRFWLLFVALFVLAALSSFRLYPALVFLTALFLELKSIRLGNRSALLPLSLVLVVFVAFFVLVGNALEAAKGNEIGGPIEVAQYRPGFTLHVFDDVVKKSFPFGYAFGGTYYSQEGNGDIAVCRMLYGCSSRIASTAFGETMLNFGLEGVFVLMFFVAAVLGKLYEIDYPLYALGMAQAIAAIEIGFNVPFIMIFAILYLRLVGWIPLRKRA